MEDLLPLFPLPNVVLFPQMPLSLHIFEPRYRQMLHDVMGHSTRFGMLLCTDYDPQTMDGLPFTIGTVAEIMECTLRADGCFDIEVVGRERFVVETFVPDQKPYLQGAVDILPDPIPTDLPPDLAQSVGERLHTVLQLHARLRKSTCELPPLPASPVDLSYLVAHTMRGSLVLKQQLLEEPSTRERLKTELESLDRQAQALGIRCQIEDVFGE